MNMSKFGKHIFQNIGSSIGSLTLTVLTAPIMARLFNASDYAVSGTMMTISSLVVSFGLLGLPLAISREHSDRKRYKLLTLAVQLAMLLVAISIVICMLSTIFGGKGFVVIPIHFLWMLPVLIVAYSAQVITDSSITAKGKFSRQSAARLANSIVARISTLVLALIFPSSAYFFMIGDISGKLTQVTFCTFKKLKMRFFKTATTQINVARQLEYIWQFKDYAIFSNFASSLPTIRDFILQITLMRIYGTDFLGHILFAQSILTLPTTLIAMSTASVVFHNFVTIAEKTPSKLYKEVLKALAIYIGFGAVCMMPIILAGGFLFSFFLGTRWHISGDLATYLAIPQIVIFCTTGLTGLFRVFRRLGLWLIYECVSLVVFLLLLTQLQSDFTELSVTRWLAVCILVSNLVILFGLLHSVRRTSSNG